MPVIGIEARDSGIVACILKKRDVIRGHSLKRGALNTGMNRGIHPSRIGQLGRHKNYTVLDTYLELGDPLEGDPARTCSRP